MSNYCSHGTLPHFSLQSSHLNTCYYHQDLYWELLDATSRSHFYATSTASYSSMHTINYIEGRVYAPHLSAIHFRGWSIRLVCCYTLLSRYRLPWPLSSCHNEPTPFMGSLNVELGASTRAIGSSHIASSAYQSWPTKGRSILWPIPLSNWSIEPI